MLVAIAIGVAISSWTWQKPIPSNNQRADPRIRLPDLLFARNADTRPANAYAGCLPRLFGSAAEALVRVVEGDL